MITLLTVTQAADELRISPQRVRKLISEGRIKATRFGQRVLMIESSALDAVRNLPHAGRPKNIRK